MPESLIQGDLLSWVEMHRRCRALNRKSHKHYVDKNITVCKEWEDFITFKERAIKNGYNDNLSINRINNSRGYKSENCRFVNWRIQANNKDNNRIVTIDNNTMTLSEAVDNHSNLTYNRVHKRLNTGWTLADSLSKPVEPQYTLIKVFGEELTMVDTVRKFGKVNYITFITRLTKNWNPEEALITSANKTLHNQKTKFITAFGITKSEREWARDERVKVSRGILRYRLRQGWTPEDTISKPLYC